MTEEFEKVQKRIDELSTEIIKVEPQPSQWSGWMVRILENLEFEAAEWDDEGLERYEEMLKILQDAIDQRLNNSRW